MKDFSFFFLIFAKGKASFFLAIACHFVLLGNDFHLRDFFFVLYILRWLRPCDCSRFIRISYGTYTYNLPGFVSWTTSQYNDKNWRSEDWVNNEPTMPGKVLVTWLLKMVLWGCRIRTCWFIISFFPNIPMYRTDFLFSCARINNPAGSWTGPTWALCFACLFSVWFAPTIGYNLGTLFGCGIPSACSRSKIRFVVVYPIIVNGSFKRMIVLFPSVSTGPKLLNESQNNVLFSSVCSSFCLTWYR